jgi:carbon-monoxide dehydrogenase medium subunit
VSFGAAKAPTPPNTARAGRPGCSGEARRRGTGRVTGAHGDGVFRSADIEKALTGSWTSEAVQGVTVSPEGMLADIHGSAAYRANLVKVMAKRAVAAAG